MYIPEIQETLYSYIPKGIRFLQWMPFYIPFHDLSIKESFITRIWARIYELTILV